MVEQYLLFVHIIATIISLIAAWLSYRYYKIQISTVLLDCLEKYILIQRTKIEAIEKNNVSLAKAYYRELFDLHWCEYQIFKFRQIPEKVMKAWLDSRFRNFRDEDCITLNLNSNEIKVIYNEMWETLKHTRYYAPGDTFIRFMDLVHDNQIKEAFKLVKEE